MVGFFEYESDPSRAVKLALKLFSVQRIHQAKMNERRIRKDEKRAQVPNIF